MALIILPGAISVVNGQNSPDPKTHVMQIPEENFRGVGPVRRVA